jgi:hypothetical protein
MRNVAGLDVAADRKEEIVKIRELGDPRRSFG